VETGAGFEFADERERAEMEGLYLDLERDEEY